MESQDGPPVKKVLHRHALTKDTYPPVQGGIPLPLQSAINQLFTFR